MKKPRTDRFDPNQPQRDIQPEDVDLSGVPEIKKSTTSTPTTRAEQSPAPSQPEPAGAQTQVDESTQAYEHPRQQEPEQASTIASTQANVIESIRKVVKDTGKDVAYVRLTSAEKRRLEDAVDAFRRLDAKTSENEILRIALGWLLEDYQARAQSSVLAKVIEALNA